MPPDMLLWPPIPPVRPFLSVRESSMIGLRKQDTYSITVATSATRARLRSAQRSSTSKIEVEEGLTMSS